MTLTAKGFPYPVSGDGRPHIDQDIAALAARVEAVLDQLSDAEIAALAGVDLWDGRLLMQSNAGAVRKWRGLYEYISATPAWRCLVPAGAWATFTPVLTATSVNPNLGVGATVRGWYALYGALCFGRAQLQQGGTSGYSVGTGTWLVSLPVAHAYGASNKPIGNGLWKRNSAPYSGSVFGGQLVLTGSQTAKIVGTHATNGDLGSTNVPFNSVPTPTGQLDYSFRYRWLA